MLKKANEWAKENHFTLTVAVLAISLVLGGTTVAIGPLWSGWQRDIMWVILGLGWIVTLGALGLLSLNLWADLDARLRTRRQAKEDIEKAQERERQRRQREKESHNNKQQLAVRIWEECKGEVPNRTYAMKLRGLDPFLDEYESAYEAREYMWVTTVAAIIARTDPSAEALDRLRTVARNHLERFDLG